VIYPEIFEEKTGFDKIRLMIEEACISDAGIEAARKMKAAFTYDKVVHQLQITEEYRNILLLSEPIPAQNYFDLTDELTEIKLPGTFLETEELGLLKASLITLVELYTFFSTPERKEKYPLLTALSEELYIDPEYQNNLRNFLTKRQTSDLPHLKNLQKFVRKSNEKNQE